MATRKARRIHRRSRAKKETGYVWEHAEDIRSLLLNFERSCQSKGGRLKCHNESYQEHPSKFSMDLMPSLFGRSSESASQLRRSGCPYANCGNFAIGMRLVRPHAFTLQLVGSLFQLSKPRAHRCVHYPCYKDKTNVGQMKFGVEYNQPLQSCQDQPCASCAKFALDPLANSGYTPS